MQRTTPGTSGSDYNYFMVSGVVGGGRQDKNLSPMSLNTIPVYEITKAATKRAKSLLTTCEFVVRDRPRRACALFTEREVSFRVEASTRTMTKESS